jgi:glutathione S-transferase
MGLIPDEEAIAAAMPKAQAVFAELARQLNDNEFFTGNSVSLADILLAAHIDFLRATPEWAPLTQGRDNLRSWLERMNERPSLKATTWERIAAMDQSTSIA